MTSPSFEPVIGLEVHVELLTRTKMFCACAVVDPAQSEPNRSVCEVCLGLPGTLPVINERAVELALRVALALGCRIAPESLFARKNYFYPDLPKGFQISQYEAPLASGGVVAVPSGTLGAVPFEGRERTVRIRRVHLEEDTGKLVHRGQDSLVDFNRAGVPLLEIVSEPDLTSVEQAKAFATELRSLLRTLGVTSGDMEKGAIRFEANISRDRQRARPDFGRAGQGLRHRAALPAPHPRRHQRRHGEGRHSLRGQHLRPALQRHDARHSDRDQEPELVPGDGAGGDVRDRAPGAAARRRAGGRAGNARLGRSPPRDAVAAGQGRRPRLPLFPRAGPASAARRPGVDRKESAVAARAAGCPPAFAEAL